jgi:DNA-binding transcriptional LysR family regulator
MDWSSLKFDWNRARAFLVTAEEGSLSAAARALGMAQPTLGRQVDALEQELNVTLFQREGRGLILTPSGLELLEHVRVMGDAANLLSLAAFGQSQTIEGSVCISASELYATQLLPPIIAQLRKLEPGIDVEIVASHTTSDLRRREADIAIRNYRPKEGDLIARKIRDVPARLYATPQYIKELGTPRLPHDLSRADFINVTHGTALMDGLNAFGLGLTKSNFPIMTEDYNVMWACVRQGLGIGVLDARIGDADPFVQQVLPDLDPMMFPIWLVAHRELNTSRRIRRVFDHLAEEL